MRNKDTVKICIYKGISLSYLILSDIWWMKWKQMAWFCTMRRTLYTEICNLLKERNTSV